jgi:hypothetical protein
MRQWLTTGCYTQRSKTALDITGAIIVAVNLIFTESQPYGNVPKKRPTVAGYTYPTDIYFCFVSWTLPKGGRF